ncbi:PREDICTED: triacylglycerol lipase 2 [Camelina sativa]|uniref:Lipase n=1 Tax=Camelina sativa TaxID=90675 RepID=A0ABM0VAZ9_CAMSA|nr:PREDICTED: triacylglycerol lipase 2 [Camelina sativa]
MAGSVMAPSVSICLALCVLIFVAPFLIKPLEARGNFGRLPGKPPQRTASDGICASSVHVYGYKCEEHDVVTQDGYILNMQRIPEGRAGSGAGTGSGGKRQPVLIQHGILVDGMSWLLNPADQNLPLILADQGFDVWMGNTRGTRFSRRHRYLKPSQKPFWNWTWDELVSYDLPAMFDHIHGLTGQKIHYLGHSLGTLIGFASFSEKGLVDKVRSAAMLSPIAYLSHMTTVIGAIAAKSFIAEATAILGLAEFNPKSGLVGGLIKAICLKAGVDCYDLLSVITGKNCCLNASTIDLFLANEPQSTSTKNMIHLSQTVRDKQLRKYNYGSSDRNIKHYGQATPPAYNISAIPHDLPLFFSYGGLDCLADVKDVEFLLDQFKFHDVNKMNVQFVKDYAHADFIMGVTAKDVVYNQVATFFKRQV